MLDDNDEMEARQRQANAQRKAQQRSAGVTENRANAERIDAELVKVFRTIGKGFAAKKMMGRARSARELPLIYVLEKLAASFPCHQRRKVFIRLGFDPAEFLDEHGILKDRRL